MKLSRIVDAGMNRHAVEEGSRGSELREWIWYSIIIPQGDLVVEFCGVVLLRIMYSFCTVLTVFVGFMRFVL